MDYFEKKMVLFGAGKIGRSFIGQLFSRSGYRIVFVDVYQAVVDAINIKGKYKIVIKDEIEEEITISNISAIHTSKRIEIANEIREATVCAVSVGQHALPGVIPIIAEGLRLRYKKFPDLALDIIIAENMRNADIWFREQLKALMPEGYPISRLVGLVETSIGKMVPVMSAEETKADPLLVYAEAYNTLILDKLAFRNPVPDVTGLAPQENMKAWVDRKLFIHNLGHAVAAYNTFKTDPSINFLYEGLAMPAVFEKTFLAMEQSAAILMALHTCEFTPDQLEDHIKDLLKRFQNRFLGDTVHRVGCDLPRKLSPEDRLVTPIKYAFEYKLPFNYIAQALYCAFSFKSTDQYGNMHAQDIVFQNLLQKHGINWILKNICKFTSREIKMLSQIQS